MQHSTTTEQKEPYTSQFGADQNNSKNYPLLTRDDIPYTPFKIVGNEELGYNIIFGRYKFNPEPLKTKTEAHEWFEHSTWDVIMHLIAIGITADKHDEKH